MDVSLTEIQKHAGVVVSAPQSSTWPGFGMRFAAFPAACSMSLMVDGSSSGWIADEVSVREVKEIPIRQPRRPSRAARS